MALEEGLEKFRANESRTFNTTYPECGIRLPDIPIGKFLRENEEACGLKPDSDLYKLGDKNLHDYCFEVAQARNNGNNHKDNGNNGHKEVDNEEVKELYKALEKYTNNKISAFKNKEEHKEKLGITREDLIKEKNKILPFVRAREALKAAKVINYDKAAIEQKIRDAKLVRRLTVKAG